MYSNRFCLHIKSVLLRIKSVPRKCFPVEIKQPRVPTMGVPSCALVVRVSSIRARVRCLVRAYFDVMHHALHARARARAWVCACMGTCACDSCRITCEHVLVCSTHHVCAHSCVPNTSCAHPHSCAHNVACTHALVSTCTRARARVCMNA